MELLKQEVDKDKPTYEVVKSLMSVPTHTKRQKILEATTALSVSQMTEDLPVLKKWNYVSIILYSYVAKRLNSIHFKYFNG